MNRIYLVSIILLVSTICCCGTSTTTKLMNTQVVVDQIKITPEKIVEEKPTQPLVVTETKSIILTATREEGFLPYLTMTVTDTSEPSHISGLNPEDILEEFSEKYNLECLEWSYGWNVWSDECITTGWKDPSYGFTVYSRNKNTVDFIEASVLQFDNPTIEIITSYFLDVLELPYVGASPEIVIGWIDSQISNMDGTPGDIREYNCSGINYRLYGNVKGMWLEIGEIEQYIEMP